MNQIILKTIKDLNEWKLINKKNINFIPTMGNLHQGHLALIKEAKKSKNGLILLSIFINPLQFEDKKDLKNYPITLNHDIKIAFASGADVIFIPILEEIFPKESSEIEFVKASKDLSKTLCGIYRQGHFDGVCTVVYRLIKLIRPQTILLGEKDWQQLLIIKRMVKDKNIKIKIKSIDTERDKDGVPFSSRNNLLLEKDRQKLKLFSKELSKAKIIFNQTKTISFQDIKQGLENKYVNIEYLEHVNAFSLQKSIPEENITLLAGAIICGKTRLIDHVFLMKRNPIIAIDGPAGSGKSTVTKLLANKLNFIYLDTGAMYRALSWYLLNEKINYKNIKELNTFLNNVSIKFKSGSNSIQDVIINEHVVTERIRTQKISKIVSSIASIKQVREFLVREQREIGLRGGIVAEGRDIGSKVFPDSELKIFLTATIDERARRRKLELEAKGFGEINFEELKNEIRKRDYDDSNRDISPLIKADDAVEIISDGISIDNIVDQIYRLYQEKIPKELQIDTK